MALRYGPTAVTFSIDDAPGGTSRAMEGFVVAGFEIGHEAETAEITAFGNTFRAHVPTGLKNHEDMDLTLIFDTTTNTGTHDVFRVVDDGPNDTPREALFGVGGSIFYFMDVFVTKYKVVMDLDNIQMANVTLRPTSTGVWTTST